MLNNFFYKSKNNFNFSFSKKKKILNEVLLVLYYFSD